MMIVSILCAVEIVQFSVQVVTKRSFRSCYRFAYFSFSICVAFIFAFAFYLLNFFRNFLFHVYFVNL